jgi:hypothetical protein
MENSPNTNLLMYFHTTIRNVGLFTTLAYASLTYSRAYRGKDSMYDVLLILISIAFLIIAAIINYSLYKDVQLKIQNNKSELLNILYVVFGIHCILLILGIITALRSMSIF